MTDMNPTPEEIELFEKEAWGPFAESYAPKLSPGSRYNDMLHGWLTAHRAREGEVERLREFAARVEPLLKSVGHIGVDFGFGPYDVGRDDISLAQELHGEAQAFATTPADRKSYPDDHGQYESTCVRCEHSFTGGKGRKLCRQCADSNGSGVQKHTCRTCGGSGLVGEQPTHQNPDDAPCEPCPDCNGNGVPDSTVDAMVEAFLTWELPKTISPDGGLEFTPLDHPHEWPVGTNMLSAPEAKAMVIHILSEAGFRLDAAPQPTNAAGEQGGE